MNDALRQAVRLQAGREAEPSAAIIDSQSVKTTETKGQRGYDSHKKVTGRKRHLLVDVLGLILVVLVHKASIQERAGAKALLQRAKDKGFPRLHRVWSPNTPAPKLGALFPAYPHRQSDPFMLSMGQTLR